MPHCGAPTPAMISRSTSVRFTTGCWELNSSASLSPCSPTDVGGDARRLDRLGDRAGHLARRAHDHAAAEFTGDLAALAQHVEQAPLLVRRGEEPAVLSAEDAQRDAALTDHIDHLGARLTAREALHEIAATQLDRVETAEFRRIQRRRQRRGVDRPGVERQFVCRRHRFPALPRCGGVISGVGQAEIQQSSDQFRNWATRVGPDRR